MMRIQQNATFHRRGGQTCLAVSGDYDAPLAMSSALIEQGVAHQLAGRLPEAEATYRQILKNAPNDVVAMQLLGVLVGQRGRPSEAIELIGKAIQLIPTIAAFHNNLANVLRDAGRLESAVAAYRRAIELDPQFSQAYSNLGNALSDMGRLDEAIAAYSRAVELNPDDAQAFSNLGIALNDAGDCAASIIAHRKAIALNPKSAVAYNNLGVALRQSKQIVQAIAAHLQALALQPDYAEAHNNLGVALLESGRVGEAILAYQMAIEFQPLYAEAHNNLGNALSNDAQIEEAIDSCLRAIELQPNYAEAYSNLGMALKLAGKIEAAEDAFHRAIQLRPEFAEAHCNLGVALADTGHLEKAMVSLRRAIELKPGYAEAHINLGVVLCNLGHSAESIRACSKAIELDPELEAARMNFAQVLLAQGDFERGWAEYERRWSANPRMRNVSFPQPRWRGETLNGRTILLHAEQGLGDAIHFVRYVPLVVARGGRVIIECQPELVRLFQTVDGADQVVPVGQALPKFDLHCPLMSLPLVMRTTLQSVPVNIPYIRCEPWKNELGGSQSDLKVGLVWAGRPTHSNDRNRSMKLTQFAPLAAVPGVTFHTLQKGTAAAQALSPPSGLRLVDHSAELHDFVDTASLIGALDLIVSVDSSVAHLAGALGKPVWVLLPFVPDWRWMRDRTDTPWYPTMRLFRQTQWGSWDHPLAELAKCLNDLAKHTHDPTSAGPPLRG
jgi:Flp pilus assembly protein TadD